MNASLNTPPLVKIKLGTRPPRKRRRKPVEEGAPKNSASIPLAETAPAFSQEELLEKFAVTYQQNLLTYGITNIEAQQNNPLRTIQALHSTLRYLGCLFLERLIEGGQQRFIVQSPDLNSPIAKHLRMGIDLAMRETGVPFQEDEKYSCQAAALSALEQSPAYQSNGAFNAMLVAEKYQQRAFEEFKQAKEPQKRAFYDVAKVVNTAVQAHFAMMEAQQAQQPPLQPQSPPPPQQHVQPAPPPPEPIVPTLQQYAQVFANDPNLKVAAERAAKAEEWIASVKEQDKKYYKETFLNSMAEYKFRLLNHGGVAAMALARNIDDVFMRMGDGVLFKRHFGLLLTEQNEALSQVENELTETAENRQNQLYSNAHKPENTA